MNFTLILQSLLCKWRLTLACQIWQSRPWRTSVAKNFHSSIHEYCAWHLLKKVSKDGIQTNKQSWLYNRYYDFYLLFKFHTALIPTNTILKYFLVIKPITMYFKSFPKIPYHPASQKNSSQKRWLKVSIKTTSLPLQNRRVAAYNNQPWCITHYSVRLLRNPDFSSVLLYFLKPIQNSFKMKNYSAALRFQTVRKRFKYTAICRTI